MVTEVMIGYLFTVRAVEHGVSWEIIILVVVQFIILIAISELLLTLTSVGIFLELVLGIEYIFMSITVQPGVKKVAT